MKNLTISERERLADMIVNGSGRAYTRAEIRVRIVKVLGRLQRGAQDESRRGQCGMGESHATAAMPLLRQNASGND